MEVEASVNRLEALVEKADLDIIYVIQKLKNEFSETFKDAIQEEANPVQLMERIEKVKAEFERFTIEAKEIENEQKGMVTSLRDALTEPIKIVTKVQEHAGLQTSTHSDEIMVLLNKQCDDEDKENQTKCPDVLDAFKDTNEALRSKGRDYIAVTEEEFVDISDFVRGRAKLQDVNKVYETLYNYFKKNPKTSLTVKDITNMGLRVTGATGGSKLKVLRTLKIIQIDKQGSVKMC